MTVVTNIGHASNSAAASFTLTAASGVPAGSTIVVGIRENTTTTAPAGSSVTDSAGNTYTLATSVSTTTGRTAVLYCQNCKSIASSGTITYTKTGATTDASFINALYATGLGAYDSAALGTNLNNATATTLAITSGTPKASGETFFAFFAV